MMRRLHVSAWAFLVILCGGTGPVWGQETPQTIIERAIKARGGDEGLLKKRADRVRMKGIVFLGAKEWPFTVETTVQLPSQMKNVQQLTTEQRTYTIVQAINGEQAWSTVDGKQPAKLEPSLLNELRETLNLNRVARLTTLLRDGTVQLDLLPEARVNDRPVQVIKVSSRGRRDIRLFFDKETGFLVKTEHSLDDGSGKETVEERIYGDFRDVGGFLRAIKVVAYRKGAKVMEAELIDVKYFDRIDDAEFAKP
jgi:hypothetical protein